MSQIIKRLGRLKITVFHSFLMVYRPLYAKIRPMVDKDIYICISTDGDLPRDRVLADKAIHHTMQFFEEMGLSNMVTWFINDGGISMPLPTMPEIKTDHFCWTQKHPDKLKDLANKGYDIELHSHHMQGYWDRNGEKASYELILENIKEEKDSIESFIENYTGKTYNITGFRAGSYVANTDLYQALKILGFKFDSSEVPGLKGSQRMKHCFVDYSDVPFHKNWYYIADELLELPLYKLTMDVDPARKCTKSPIILSFFVGHPFEFINCKGERRRLRELLIRIQLKVLELCYPQATWVAMRDIPEIVKKYCNRER